MQSLFIHSDSFVLLSAFRNRNLSILKNDQMVDVLMMEIIFRIPNTLLYFTIILLHFNRRWQVSLSIHH